MSSFLGADTELRRSEQWCQRVPGKLIIINHSE
jgi:hypothetical protein